MTKVWGWELRAVRSLWLSLGVTACDCVDVSVICF